MYYFASVLNGFIMAVTIALNGILSSHYGIYPASFFIHGLGLAVLVPVMLLTRTPLRIRKRLPLWFYSAGLAGVCATALYNIAYTQISVTAILALGFVGQGAMSLAVDQFGLFGIKKRPFMKKKLIGLGIASLGVVVMFLF